MINADNPKFNDRVPHLLLKKGDIEDIVFLPGNPSRVYLFKDICDEFNIISENREYIIGNGKYKGVPISVCSTGIGGPSTEIAVIELIDIGAKALIRIGGTGVLNEKIDFNDLIITTGSMRYGGATNFYAPPEYPAIASYEVIDSMVKACEQSNTKYWKGISASIGSFFAGQGRETLGKKFYNDSIIDEYKKLNVLNMEMESETILTLANIFNVYSGCICAVHANRDTNEWIYDFNESEERLLKVALDSAVILYNQYLT